MIEELLGDVDPRTFVEDYFLKLPFAFSGGCAKFQSLGSWPTVERLLADSESDLLIVRGGIRWPEQRRPSFAEARALFDDGYTIVVRHAERHDTLLAQLSGGLANDFAGIVDTHVYCTPKSQFGFGWHYDAEDVFILQCEGSKEYSLRKNTVQPWPLIETLPADMRFEREIMPLMRCRLNAGDWLYIPAGYWHRAESQEDSISISVGLATPAAIDVFDFLRQRLTSSIRWRQRLPTPGQASSMDDDALVAEYEKLFQSLGRELALEMGRPELAREFVASKRVPTVTSGAGDRANAVAAR